MPPWRATTPLLCQKGHHHQQQRHGQVFVCWISRRHWEKQRGRVWISQRPTSSATKPQRRNHKSRPVPPTVREELRIRSTLRHRLARLRQYRPQAILQLALKERRLLQAFGRASILSRSRTRRRIDLRHSVKKAMDSVRGTMEQVQDYVQYLFNPRHEAVQRHRTLVVMDARWWTWNLALAVAPAVVVAVFCESQRERMVQYEERAREEELRRILGEAYNVQADRHAREWETARRRQNEAHPWQPLYRQWQENLGELFGILRQGLVERVGWDPTPVEPVATRGSGEAMQPRAAPTPVPTTAKAADATDSSAKEEVSLESLQRRLEALERAMAQSGPKVEHYPQERWKQSGIQNRRDDKMVLDYVEKLEKWKKEGADKPPTARTETAWEQMQRFWWPATPSPPTLDDNDDDKTGAPDHKREETEKPKAAAPIHAGADKEGDSAVVPQPAKEEVPSVSIDKKVPSVSNDKKVPSVSIDKKVPSVSNDKKETEGWFGRWWRGSGSK